MLRLVFWLGLLPALLLGVALKMTRATLADAEAGRPEGALRAAQPDPVAEYERAAARRLDEGLAQRRVLAEQCLAGAMRAVDADLAVARALLVVVRGEGCGPDCDSAAQAARMADTYSMQGLRVLYLHTRETADAAEPPGATTLVMPRCRALTRPLGDDYFLRFRDGSLAGTGARHEAWLRERFAAHAGQPPAAPAARTGGDARPGSAPAPAAPGKPLQPPFDPEPMVREALGMRALAAPR